MVDDPRRNRSDPLHKTSDFVTEAGRHAARKLKARRNPASGVWFGLGMMGLVGWSVAVPTLLGAALGLWLDARQTGMHSWTLALLVAGLVLGCVNAWHWIAREQKTMHDDGEDIDADTRSRSRNGEAP